MRRLMHLALLAGGLLTASASAQYYPNGYPGYGRVDPYALVQSWYQRFLGRTPDPGSDAWVQQLQQGNPPEAVLAGILSSDEYYQRSGNSPQGYIMGLYRDVLGHPPSPRQLNYWTQRVYTGDRQSIAYELLSRNPGVWQGSVGGGTNDYEYRRPYYPVPRYRR